MSMLYKVTIPSRSPAGYISHTTLTLPADHWMSAFTLAIEEIGEPKETAQNITCKMKGDDYVEITTVETDRTFIIERYYPEKERKRALQPTDPELLPEDTSPDLSSAPRAFKPVDSDVEKIGEESDQDNDKEIENLDNRERVDTEQDIPRVTREDRGDTETSSEEEPEVNQEDSDKNDHSDELKDLEKIAHADTIDLSDDALKAQAAARTARKKKKSFKKRTNDNGNLVETIYFDLLQLDELTADLPSLFDTSLELIRQSIDCEIATILFSDSSGRELYFAAIKGRLEDRISKFTIPITEGFFGSCVREATPFIVNNPTEDERIYHEIINNVEMELDSICCAPILHGARVYGAIGLINHSSGEFITPELTALRVVGECIGEHVYNTIMSTELNFNLG